MEDVLELYAEPFDEKRPVVGFDETSKQLIKETRQPEPSRGGAVARFDYEYERNGTRNLFMLRRTQAWMAARRSDRAAHEPRLRAADEVAR